VILSHKYNFIFIAIPKTGTTSVQRRFELMNLEGTNICNTREPNLTQPKPLFTKHIPAIELKQKCEKFDQYFKFSFVRNPYARAVSWVFYHLRNENYDLENYSFSELILRCPHWIWYPQHRWIYSNGNNLMNFVGKIESLQQDFNIVCDKIGIPQQKLPHINKSNHKHYTEYYDNETRKMVSERYAEDIEFFGYKFGE
jgi:hypothetical protein